ncbi:MAG: PEP-CTERM sorting domain-containing protein [Phycisphaerae bacterium]|nr:PEP-CTERM sorting domain-containing protein [Phycisphaerales bacterium]
MKKTFFALSMCAVLMCAASARATLIDFNIHHDGSAQQVLDIQYPSQVFQPYELPLIETGPLAGYYGSIEPGWDGEGTDRPGDGAYALESISGVSLRRESFDAGFSMYTQGLSPILEVDGALHEFVGAPEGSGLLWHQHLTFVADPGTPIGTILSAEFTLTDQDGLHADSAPFTLSFIVTPEPTTGLLLLIAAGAALRKNPRRSAKRSA